jgi:hypothetical protein
MFHLSLWNKQVASLSQSIHKLPIGIVKTKTHRNHIGTNYKCNIYITFYSSHSWILPLNRYRILNKDNTMTLQSAAGGWWTTRSRRWMSFFQLDSVTKYCHSRSCCFDYTKCTKIVMLLPLPSHCPHFCTFQTPCLWLYCAVMLHYAVTVTDLLSTNFRWLMQIQKTHECHPLPRCHTRGNLVHNKHNIVSVDTALGDTPTQPPK